MFVTFYKPTSPFERFTEKVLLSNLINTRSKINALASKFEVWAQLRVAKRSVMEIHEFFRSEFQIMPQFLVPNLHLTIYHARRPMFNVQECNKKCHLSIDTYDTRFMVLAPGGENPRPDLIPGRRKVGIRIKRNSQLRIKINAYRNLLLIHETSDVLGKRLPSTRSRSAFGARHFQPHIAILESGSGIPSDLTAVGESFREWISEIHFDQFSIQRKRSYSV